MGSVIARLSLIVWVCVKCGLIQYAAGPCHGCHHAHTVKQWLDDDYLTD